jgi:flagellin
MERLSSGKRINSASDDAAGMAVAAKLRADVRSLNQAVRNANDAVSLVNTYDGASAEIEAILVRMRELAVQSANGTYVDADRELAQMEIDALALEIDRIAQNTTFNKKNIADASSGSGTFTFRVGPLGGSADDVDVNQTTGSSFTGITINANGLHAHIMNPAGGDEYHNNMQPTIFMGSLFIFCGIYSKGIYPYTTGYGVF